MEENKPLSFVDKLREADRKYNKPKKSVSPQPPPPTGYFVQSLFGDYDPATQQQVQDSDTEIYTQDGGEFTLWNGERPEPPQTVTPQAMPTVGNLPVSSISDQFTDMRLAAVFAEMFKDELRYWPEVGKFLVFDGRRWTTDAPGGAFPFIRRMIEELYSKAAACTDYAQRGGTLKAVLRLEEHPRQKTILEAAKVRPELIVSSADLDQHHMLLTVNNGTIDLQYGTLRQHRADDFLTRMTPIDFNPQAECPRS
jgi:putative DNA primase/helicase